MACTVQGPKGQGVKFVFRSWDIDTFKFPRKPNHNKDLIVDGDYWLRS